MLQSEHNLSIGEWDELCPLVRYCRLQGDSMAWLEISMLWHDNLIV